MLQDALQSARLIYHKPLAELLDAALIRVFQGSEKSQIKIIDAGAGTGLNGVELSKLGYSYIDAIDISQEMLGEAKKTNVFTKLICASLNEHNPDIETGEYHALITAGVLVVGHVRPEALDEMIRMVRIGKEDALIFSCRSIRLFASERHVTLSITKIGRGTN